MKLKSVLKSNRDLKKNGYKIIRKLYKLERRKGIDRAYSVNIGDTYYFILGCRALADIIKIEYPDEHRFLEKCDVFLAYLETISLNRSKIDRTVLAGFLRAYTRFFNSIIEQNENFIFTQQIIDLWNINCLMAYVATWGKNN